MEYLVEYLLVLLLFACGVFLGWALPKERTKAYTLIYWNGYQRGYHDGIRGFKSKEEV